MIFLSVQSQHIYMNSFSMFPQFTLFFDSSFALIISFSQDNVRETIDYIQNVLDGSDNISRAPSQSEPAAAAALRVEVPVDESQVS